ncbi:flavin-containing monooxygenase [Penicillium nucicola]|uniref:flavin-containing monooxygenase n=1 Tax=Penicillium nucicola TaxID=1850975 RepID=UPI0025453660|nr:flavin-containing monooxygenase [Penicillium nucicola]KAJ5747711.1 flavin-containing monooxygenase [Penicillium nucicola]
MGSLNIDRHIIKLPVTPIVVDERVDVQKITQTWLTDLEALLLNNHWSSLKTLFHDESWWRDMLAMDWEFHTLKGEDKIQTFLSVHQKRSQLHCLRLVEKGSIKPRLETPVESMTWITAMFSFQSQAGRGRGVIYLTPEAVNPQIWKAYAVYTSLQELKGHEERIGPKREIGTMETMPGGVKGGTWRERRQKAIEVQNGEMTVLIIGAGQAGLNLGARLRSVGISCLLVEKNERVGDNWRNRYRTLTTHDHAETAHMAYLPFPKTWPMYTSKDKLGDWLECYANIMELDIWLNVKVLGAVYDDVKSQWTVNIDSNGLTRELHPRHVVWCAGHIALPSVPLFSGMNQFQGQIYHSSQHQDAGALNCQGKKVIVVGTGNSGHDIAQDFYNHGAEVTMLQRSGTYVITEARGLPFLPENLGIDCEDQYVTSIVPHFQLVGGNESNAADRPSMEDADVLSESLPWPVNFALGVSLTKQISQADKETLDGLEKAGFKLEFGTGNSGLFQLLVTRGGGYYIDFGCSQLIIDGKIKVKYSPGGIAEFNRTGLFLSDGTELEAEIVVLATGYDNMRDSVRTLLGDKIADRCKDVWDLDSEGEINAIWRPSGHPHFWFMGGSLSLCRIYSKFVALQLQATEQGLIF